MATMETTKNLPSNSMFTEETPVTAPQRTRVGNGGQGHRKPRGGPAYLRRYTPASGWTLFYGVLAFFLLLGIIAIILYLVYRPSTPRFSVVGAAVFELNTTTTPAPAVSASMQFTVRVSNPSERSSALYDRLSAYVVYREHAITLPAPLPPLYQEEGSAAAVSPVVGGAGAVPVSEEVVEGLRADRAYGVVRLRLVVAGRVKYRARPFASAWRRLFARCDMLAGIKEGAYGRVPLLGTPQCAVDA